MNYKLERYLNEYYLKLLTDAKKDGNKNLFNICMKYTKMFKDKLWLLSYKPIQDKVFLRRYFWHDMIK